MEGGNGMDEVPYTERHFDGTPEEVNAKWVESRKTGIGGSDVASIMGLNRYSSPYEVWMVKTGRADSPDLSGKQAVEWGNRLEPLVADKFAECHPELRVEVKEATLVSKERPWAFANLDRLLTDGNGRHGILEVKTAGAFRAPDWEDGVPVYYQTQVAHYMAVTGFDYAYFAVLIGGQEYREFRYDRDEEDVAAVTQRVDSFWHGNVEADIPPAIIGTQGEAEALFSGHSADDGEYEAVMDSDVPDIDELERLKDTIKLLTQEKKEIENRLRLRIGDRKGIETPTVRVTWSRGARASLDAKRLKEENPDLVSEYMVAKVVDRGIRIKRKEIEWDR